MEEIPDWIKEVSKKENRDEFSELVHNYCKLASMRIMQEMREKYSVPPDQIPNLIISIFSRMLNEACYAVGGNIRTEKGINQFYSKEHLLNLVKVLNGDPINQEDRTDIDIEIQLGLVKFKEFVSKNAREFFFHLPKESDNS